MADPFNLHKRGKFWVPDFTLHGIRVHKSTKCTVKADAIERCETWAAEIRNQVDGKLPAEQPPSLRDVYSDWHKLKKAQGISKSHLKDARLAVEVYGSEWADRPITELTNAAVEEIRASYMSSPGKGYSVGAEPTVRTHSAGGANRIICSLSTLCAWAVEMGKIQIHPFKIKKLKVQEKAKSVLWPEQVRSFIDEADRGGVKWASSRPRDIEHSATALRMMVGLGLREGEALNADWGWIDWRRNVFIVGGVSLGRQVMIKDRSIREIPIPGWLLDHLQAIWIKRKKPVAGVILPREGGLPHETGFTGKPVRRCGAKLGIPDLTPHALRRTFATGHFETGTSLSQIQQMLGHASPETTMKHYIIQRPLDQAMAQELLAARMGFERSPKNHPKI
jgi:integrase/recombinase XerC